MIKLFLTDLDGVLTNSTYLVLPDGLKVKTFNTRDFVGLKELHKAGCEVGVITGDSTNECVVKQMERAAPFAHLFEGVNDKKSHVEKLIQTLGITWDEVAFIGDDTNDLGLLSVVGLPACPQDAVPRVKEFVLKSHDGMVIPYSGGTGCVRDFADLVRAVHLV